MNFQNSIELTAISQPQIQLQLKQKQKDVIVTRCPQLSIGASGIFYHQKTLSIQNLKNPAIKVLPLQHHEPKRACFNARW